MDVGEYPDFVETCGLGKADGLLGVNCRHSYSPYYPGVSQPRWDEEALSAYREASYTYTGIDGKERTVGAYDATQMQRGLEREVRFWKRRVAVAGAAGLDAEKDKAKLKYWQKRLVGFTEQTGLRRQHFRERA